MATVLWVLLALLIGTLTWLLLRRGITAASFLAISTVWIALLLLFLIGPETIAEIVIGSVTIKRDVQAAREIRNRVESLAEETRAASKDVRVLAEEIRSISRAVQTAEARTTQTAENLRGAVEAMVDATYIAIQTRSIFPIPDPAAKRIGRDLNALANFARPNRADREKWLDELKSVLTKSGAPIR